MKKELQGVPVSKASATIWKEWKMVKVSDKKMKKYKELYEKENRQHEEALQRYQENHTNKMEIINLYKWCNMTNATTNTGAKAAAKAPRWGYHLFLESSLMRWQERIEETIAVWCQEVGRRLQKILQGYLYTMIGPYRWRMKQRKLLNWVMILR